MLDLVFSNRFKRGLDLNLLDEVIEKLRKRQPLDKKHKDHSIHHIYPSLFTESLADPASVSVSYPQDVHISMPRWINAVVFINGTSTSAILLCRFIRRI